MTDKLDGFRDPTISERSTADQYDELPDGIKSHYTRIEYAWLSDTEKTTLIQRETEPDA
jgi:hypothetical protein